MNQQPITGLCAAVTSENRRSLIIGSDNQSEASTDHCAAVTSGNGANRIEKKKKKFLCSSDDREWVELRQTTT